MTADRRPPTVARILDAAARVAGAVGLERASLLDVARAAGVPLGLLRYHYRSPEHLLIETQRAVLRRVHEGFEARFAAGETGIDTALEALDALWAVIQDLAPVAPFVVQTMASATRDPSLAERLHDFNAEALARVELGLLRAMPGTVHRLALPPERLARAVRTGLYGLLVELAAARTDAEIEAVRLTYDDVRGLLARVVLDPGGPEGRP